MDKKQKRKIWRKNIISIIIKMIIILILQRSIYQAIIVFIKKSDINIIAALVAFVITFLIIGIDLLISFYLIQKKLISVMMESIQDSSKHMKENAQELLQRIENIQEKLSRIEEKESDETILAEVSGIRTKCDEILEIIKKIND